MVPQLWQNPRPLLRWYQKCQAALMRLYRPDSGRILLNGVDIWQYREEEYWKLMSVVFQNFKIFSISIKQNMEAGYPEENQEL